MKALTIAIVIVLFIAGIGGGYYFLTQTRGQDAPAEATPAVIDSAAGEDDAVRHGTFPEIPPGAEICSEHRVPEVVCPFCNQQFVESAGHCGGHDVPEALCTRCHPILIAAFKAEGDWCEEHELPESQCLICNPESDG